MQSEEFTLRRKIEDINAARFCWKMLTICCVVFWLISNCQPHIRYVFQVYDNQIDMIKSQWFHRDETVSVTWRKNADGDLGWCTRDKNGEWYIFFNEALDEKLDAN